MALIRQGGASPEGVLTTQGLKANRSPLCHKCHQRKPGLYSINVNGQPVCADCAGSVGHGVLQEDMSDKVATRDPDPQPSSAVPGLAIMDMDHDDPIPAITPDGVIVDIRRA